MSDPKAIYKDPLGRQYDPLPVYRKLVLESRGRINDLLADWESDDILLQTGAEEELVRVSRVAFQFTPFSQPNGHTDAQVLETLVHYLDYVAKKEQGPKSGRTVQRSTVSAPVINPTTPCSDCG